MNKFSRVPFATTLVLLCPIVGAALAEPKIPRPQVDGWQVQLVVAEPELVTPVSCCFDRQGRLFVVESHTHFPPEDYQGPQEDRIYVFDQFKDEPGAKVVRNRKRLFHAGGTATMGLAVLDDGWLAVATRSELIKLRDSDGDGQADERITLLKLETEANYPHNGLGGLARGPDGRLYVGQGENLGSPYRLVATDGSQQVGGGEGGNVFRCTTDGRQLQRVATGFWNPFGLYFDSADRMWAVGNDPDARPPCRLLNIVPGGDYGFQFRFGRAGTNPLLAWNGELPGTLPMTAGTGEAPCAVLGVNGALWVTSWGSHRLERFRLRPHGASWQADMDVIVQGEPDFRPVGMALSPDGSIFVTDWADRSYPVHGKGRLWRITPLKDADESANLPELTPSEVVARRLESGEASVSQCLAGLTSDDPFIRQAGGFGLVVGGNLGRIQWQQLSSPAQQVGVLSAWRWLELTSPEDVTSAQRASLLESALAVESERVNLAAVRWATETGDNRWLTPVRELLERTNLSAELFAAVMASISYLETGSAAGGQRDPQREALLAQLVADTSKPVALRARAMQLLPPEAESPTNGELSRWLEQSVDPHLGREAVRLLAARGAQANLSTAAKNASLAEQVRADAFAGLASNAVEHSQLIGQMARPNQPASLQEEARRLRWMPSASEQGNLPNPNDLSAWQALLAGQGDIEAGRRVFYRRACAKCHAHSGRGSRIGPDLTHIARQMSSERLLESILLPSRDVGPLYVPWQVLTLDGEVLAGMRLEKSGAGGAINFLNSEGNEFAVELTDIDVLQPASESIMPSGLEKTMSLAELRDLLAFLMRIE